MRSACWKYARRGFFLPSFRIVRTYSTTTATTSTQMAIGQVLHGSRGSYRLLEKLQSTPTTSSVFKASVVSKNVSTAQSMEVLSELEASNKHLKDGEYVLIKIARLEAEHTEHSKASMIREYNTYHLPKVASCRSIRSMIDFIGVPREMESETPLATPPCLVLEWLDCTLSQVSSKIYGGNIRLVHGVFEAGLTALQALAEEGKIHTDLKPDNILISNLGSGHPIVKIGDLGSVQPDGFGYDAQPFAMRAPEVYRGIGCFHRSDVWSLVVTVFCWYNNYVFGNVGNKWGFSPEGYSIAKLMVLFPGWKGPPVDKEAYFKVFYLAERLVDESDPLLPNESIVKVKTLEEEMGNMALPPAVKAFLRSLFVIDHNLRPSATEALSSREYGALDHASTS